MKKFTFNIMGKDSISIDGEFKTVEEAKAFYLELKEIFNKEAIGAYSDRYAKNSYSSNNSYNNKPIDPNEPATEKQLAYLRKQGTIEENLPKFKVKACEIIANIIRNKKGNQNG